MYLCSWILSVLYLPNLYGHSHSCFLPIEVQATVIDPADIEGLEAALNNNKVGIEESG